MRPLYGLALIAALVMAPEVADAQQRPQQRPAREAPGNRGGMMQRQMQPFAIYLENKETLKLTAEQIEKIEQISKELEEKNRPLREKMPRRQGGPGSGPPSPEARAEMQKVMEEMRKNIEDANEKVQALLTPEQREAAAKLMEERRREMMRRGPGNRPRGGR